MHGKYKDTADELDLLTLHQYYGVTRAKPSRKHGETGAGHDDPEEEEDDDPGVEPKEIAKKVGQGQQRQV
jgi:hypothetical protein